MKLLGTHVLLYSRDADADRAFLAEVLEWRSVDAGGGWLIFGLPPAEIAVHPADGEAPGPDHSMLTAHVYLMCEDVAATMASLAARGVICPPVQAERWGLRTSIPLPSGGSIGLYQPRHPVAVA